MINLSENQLKIIELDTHYYCVALDSKTDIYHVWRKSNSGTNYIGKQRRQLGSNTFISYESAMQKVIQSDIYSD